MERLVKIECGSIAASREILDRMRVRVAYDLVDDKLFVYGDLPDGVGEPCGDVEMTMRLRRVYLDSRSIEIFLLALQSK